jgi:hypothetical protein
MDLVSNITLTGNETYVLATDQDFIYISTTSNGVITKLNKTDLSIAANTNAFGDPVLSMVTDANFIYAAGGVFSNHSVKAWHKSNFNFFTASNNVPQNLFSMTQDSSFLYACGNASSATNGRIRKFFKSNLALALTGTT